MGPQPITQKQRPIRRERSFQDDERRRSWASDLSRDKMPPTRPSEAERRYTPPETPRVRFPGDPDQREEYERSRARERYSLPSPPSSREDSRSRSRSRASRRRSAPRTPEPESKEDKPWFKKKTLWASMATLATVASLIPTTRAANASVDASRASQKSANASVRSALAGERSAAASAKSANAVTNTTIAAGHQDHLGRYTGPPKHARIEAGSGGGGRRAIEYGAGSIRSSHSGSNGRRRY